jgi:hypothetical protein
MGQRRYLCALAVALAALAAPSSAFAADPVIAAAGDIACDPDSAFFNDGAGDSTHCRQRATSDLLTGGSYARVLPLGDTQYENGDLAKFQASYHPSWGRVLSISRPVVGNHEYETSAAAGYFDYFNGAGNLSGPAGDRSKGYYSYDVFLPSGARWHIVALNSECGASSAGTVGQAGACDAGSAQEQWVRADLAANATSCTLAYWHHPLFSSGGIGNNPVLQQIWTDLYDAGADVVLNGHDHNYERFAPQKPDGTANASYGLREFVVGTGGKSLLAMGVVKANSEVRQNSTYGVMELTLHDNGYDWRFASEAGQTYTDTGSQTCHGRPPTTPPTATTVEAGSITNTAARTLGTVNPKNQTTSYRVQYGTTTAYGLSTPTHQLPAGNVEREVVSALSGLTGATTYHYRLVATNAAGTTYGQDRTFTTRSATSSAYRNDVLATPGLQGYWRLGNSAGTAAADATGRFPGTYSGGFRLGRPGILYGDANFAAGFDGTLGEMTAGGPALSTTGSIEGWFYWQRGGVLLRDNTAASAGGWLMGWDNGGNLYYRVAGKNFATGRSAATYKDAWHHFALVKNAGNVAFYIDGALVHSGTGAPNTAAVMPWHLMRNGTYTTYAGGRVDELAIYNSALTASQVARHYSLAGSG